MIEQNVDNKVYNVEHEAYDQISEVKDDSEDQIFDCEQDIEDQVFDVDLDVEDQVFDVDLDVEDQVFDVDLDLEQMDSSEGLLELDGEELSEVSGAGLREGIGAYAQAKKLGGSLPTRLTSFWRGLQSKTEKDANVRATRLVKVEKKRQEFQKRFQKQKRRSYTGFN